MPKGYCNPGLERARVKTYFQKGNTASVGVNVKAGAHRDVNANLLPRDVIVTMDQTADDLAEHVDVLFAFNEMLLTRMREREDVALSGYIGDYLRYGVKSAHLAECLRTGSVRPGEYGELSREQVTRLKQRYARMVENGRAQLLLVRRYADAEGKNEEGETVLLHDVVENGKAPYWLDELNKLLTSTTTAIREWAALLVWEERRGMRKDTDKDRYLKVIGIGDRE